jgi:hypothetical protein
LGPVKVVSTRTVPISVAFGPIGEREARSQNRTVPSAPPEISVTEQALDTDTRAKNCLVRELRAFGGRIATELKERWRTLKRGHPQPQPYRRHSPRRPCPQPPLEVIFTEKTSLTSSPGCRFARPPDRPYSTSPNR